MAINFERVYRDRPPRTGLSARLRPVARPLTTRVAATERRGSTPAGAQSHRTDIQGLRALAVVLVVLGHAGVTAVPGGFVGVDVFFVLSGFLITGLLLAEARAHGSISLSEFYVRRARRLLPAAALTLLVTNVAAYFLLNFLRAEQAVEDSLYAAAFAANFNFAARDVDYFAQGEPPSAVLHYWSLSVEEQFYFVWPLLLSLSLFGALLRRRERPRRERRLLVVIVLLTAASFAWSMHATETLPEAAYFSPFTRAWELGLGATIAVAATTLGRIPTTWRCIMGWLGIAAITLAAVAFSEQTPFPGFAALLPTVGTALAIVAGLGARPPRFAVGRLLSLLPLRVVGDRSYALYLWHWPVLILAEQYVGDELPVTTKLGLVGAAFVLSCLTYALVEDPIRRKVRTRTATAIVVVVSTAAVLGSASASLAAIDRDQQRFEGADTVLTRVSSTSVRHTARSDGTLPAVVAAVGAARRGAPIPAGLTPPISLLWKFPAAYKVPNKCIGHDSSARVATAVCRVVDNPSAKVVVLMGDSHAYMWLPAVMHTARSEGWTFVPLLRLGCTPNKWTTSEGSAACRAWYGWAQAQIRQLRPDIILLGGSIPEQQTLSSRRATAGIVAAAQALEPLGKVVVIGDPEGLDLTPADCILSRRATMGTCTTTWGAASLAAYDEVARGTKRHGVGFLRTRGFVCHDRRCPAVIGRTIAWMDNNHITPAYAVEIADAFRAGLHGALATVR